MFSLKRTLRSNIATSIEVLNHVNQDHPGANLHTPLRYSAVLLSIGKNTQACHRNIPLKKIRCNETVTYISAISRKLESIWQQPRDDIAEGLLSVLRAQDTQPLWSGLRRIDDGWIEFVISQGGIAQWQQQLKDLLPPGFPYGPPWPMEPETLWQLQSGYELCCRWQAHYHSLKPVALPPMTLKGDSSAPFLLPCQPLQDLVHGLLDICDHWQQGSPRQLVQQAQQVVVALDVCVGCTRPASAEARVLSGWLMSAGIVLKHLLHGRLGHQLVDRF